MFILCLLAQTRMKPAPMHTLLVFSTKQSGTVLRRPDCVAEKLTVCSEEVKDSLSKNNNNKKPPPSYGWCGGMVLDEMRLEKFFSKTSQRRFCWQGKGNQKLRFKDKWSTLFTIYQSNISQISRKLCWAIIFFLLFKHSIQKKFF